jgi:hypothetical protein
MRGGGVAGSQPMSTAMHNAHGAQIYVGDQTPYLTYASLPSPLPPPHGWTSCPQELESSGLSSSISPTMGSFLASSGPLISYRPRRP